MSDEDKFIEILSEQLKESSDKENIINQSKLACELLTQNNFDSYTTKSCLLWPLVTLGIFNPEKLNNHIDEEILSILNAGKMLKKNSENILPVEKLREHLKQLTVAATINIKVIFVQIGFWYAELVSLKDNKNKELIIQTAENALNIYAPIAHRFGFYIIKNQLEEISFSYLNPEKYNEINNFLLRFNEHQLRYFNKIIKDCKEFLNLETIEHDFTLRTKGIYSTYKKSIKKNINYKELHDLIACRIVVKNISDCYRALGIIHSKYNLLESKLKDYISRPKNNGYQSLHTTVISKEGVVFEVQIRTKKMHQQAEYGISAHFGYKEGSSVEVKSLEQLVWLREIIDNFSKNKDQHEALDSLKRELYLNTIYVFTPQGKMIKLPAGASIIDFAYEIHTEIGNKCFGAKVDGKFLPIRTKLTNGQIVEIITNNASNPKSDWLKHCVTNKSRNHIRNSVKKQSLYESAIHGERILAKILDRNKINIKNFLENKNLRKFLDKKKLNTIDDLYLSIGFGTLDANDCYKYVISPSKPTFRRKIKNIINKQDNTTITKTNIEGIPTRLAKCCHPLQGDKVVGIISNSGLIKIHLKDCVNIRGINKNQIINLDWNIGYSKYIKIPLQFEFGGGIKTLNIITATINKLKIKMSRSSTEMVDRKKSIMRFSVELEIDNIDQIEDIKKQLSRYNITINHSIDDINTNIENIAN